MKAVVHIQLVEDYQELPFQTEFHQFVSTEFQEVEFFELDNFSGSEMISYAWEMIQRTTLILLVVESRSGQAYPGKLIRLFNQIVKEKPAHLQIVLLGKHPVIEKIAKPLANQFRPILDRQQLEQIATDLLS